MLGKESRIVFLMLTLWKKKMSICRFWTLTLVVFDLLSLWNLFVTHLPHQALPEQWSWLQPCHPSFLNIIKTNHIQAEPPYHPPCGFSSLPNCISYYITKPKSEFGDSDTEQNLSEIWESLESDENSWQ